MEPHSFGGIILLVILLDAALWMAMAGVALVLHGLLLSVDWPHVTSGCIMLGLSLTAGSLTVLLSLPD